MSHAEQRTVLVTGAAGTVGHYAVALAEAAGHRVIANDLTRRGVQVPARGEVRPGDLRDPEVVQRVVDGVDAVIHAAAVLDSGASLEALREVNTHVVERLYAAAGEAGATRFVHLSTAMLYREGQRGPLAEEAPVSPRGAHGRSKLDAEELLRAKEGGPAWTILRPAPLYGRRGRHLAASLLAVGPIMRLVSPVLPRLSGGPTASMVHAEDVARAAIFVLSRADAEGETFNVADEDAITLGDRVEDTLAAYGLPTLPTGQLPDDVLERVGRFFGTGRSGRAADRAALAAWRVVVVRHGLKSALRVRLDAEARTLLYDDLVVDAGKLRGLGWLPRYPRFREGFQQVLRWYQAERWVPRY